MARGQGSRLSRRVVLRGLAASPVVVAIDACNFTRGQPSDTGAGDAGIGTPPVSDALLADFEPCAPLLTPLDDFLAIQTGDVPAIDADAFAVTIDGLVANPVEVTLADLEASADAVTVLNSLHCALGPVGTQLWTGVPLRGLIERAGPDLERVRGIRLYGQDGHDEGIHFDDVFDDSRPEVFPPLLAFRIAGAALPPRLGFPFRALLGGRTGYKNVKWLRRIELVGEARTGAEVRLANGYGAGRIPTLTRLQGPTTAELAPGPIEICGHVMGGRSGIVGVDLVVDGGTPQEVPLLSLEALLRGAPEISLSEQAADRVRHPYPWAGVWTPFAIAWDAEPGQHTLQLRVTDRAGTVDDRLTFDVTVG